MRTLVSDSEHLETALYRRFLPTTYNLPRFLQPAKRNWRDAVVLAAEGDWPAQADWLLSPSLGFLTSILSPLTSDRPRRERSELSISLTLSTILKRTLDKRSEPEKPENSFILK